MNQEKPKVYTAEFRESSVKLATESDKPVAQTARDIDVPVFTDLTERLLWLAVSSSFIQGAGRWTAQRYCKKSI